MMLDKTNALDLCPMSCCVNLDHLDLLLGDKLQLYWAHLGYRCKLMEFGPFLPYSCGGCGHHVFILTPV